MSSVTQNVAVPEFSRSDTRISQLLDYMRDISALTNLGSLAGWDQNTLMPSGAAEVRGNQMAVLQGILHDKWSSDNLGKLLAEIEGPVQNAPFTDADRGLIWQAVRGHTQSTKLPRSLVEEMARHEAVSYDAWHRARTRNDFALFAPFLAHTIKLQREMADLLGYVETRYDALLDQYEPGLTASRVNMLFTPVRNISTALLRRIQASGNKVDTSPLEGNFASDKQVELSVAILKGIGYDFERGAIAQSPHPFTTDIGTPFDVRVTIRTNEHLLQQSLMAAIHEGGHALYEQGSARTLVNTPVAGGTSLGIHESQSRLWENEIGRSVPFWQGQFALVKKVFPEQFANVDAATFARALNHVEPSLIRVEADEVTYNLHIIIRFELEKQVINDNIAVESLPRMWNEKYQEYLGITPPNDADGILQDVHWSSGFGYFPTYSLGNLNAAQIYNTLRKAIPNFDETLAQGNTAPILSWLREHMYSVGAIYRPDELMQRVTGETLNPDYFTDYLVSKFEGIYGLTK